MEGRERTDSRKLGTFRSPKYPYLGRLTLWMGSRWARPLPPPPPPSPRPTAPSHLPSPVAYICLRRLPPTPRVPAVPQKRPCMTLQIGRYPPMCPRSRSTASRPREGSIIHHHTNRGDSRTRAGRGVLAHRRGGSRMIPHHTNRRGDSRTRAGRGVLARRLLLDPRQRKPLHPQGHEEV